MANQLLHQVKYALCVAMYKCKYSQHYENILRIDHSYFKHKHKNVH